MEEINTGGRSNGKSLENAITFMKYLDELENNKLYGIKKTGNITLLTKTECIPISSIEKEIEEYEEIGMIGVADCMKRLLNESKNTRRKLKNLPVLEKY